MSINRKPHNGILPPRSPNRGGSSLVSTLGLAAQRHMPCSSVGSLGQAKTEVSRQERSLQTRKRKHENKENAGKMGSEGDGNQSVEMQGSDVDVYVMAK